MMDIKTELKNQSVLFMSILISSCILFKYMSVKSIMGYDILISHSMIFGVNVNEHVLIFVLSLCLAVICTIFCFTIKCLFVLLYRFMRKIFK